MSYGNAHIKSALQQLLNLEKSPLMHGTGRVRLGKLEWECEIQPTFWSRNYTIKLKYNGNKPKSRPNVFVVRPDIVRLAKGKIDHIYQKDPVELCLYHPRKNPWNASMLFSDTIIPWTYLWLYYFEDQLINGKWNGGGEHPTNSSK